MKDKKLNILSPRTSNTVLYIIYNKENDVIVNSSAFETNKQTNKQTISFITGIV